MIRTVPLMAVVAILSACDVPPPDPETVARECEQRARAAQGPTGSVTVGSNSNSGPYTNVAIGITGDYLLGRDANTVYATCVQQRTGQAPIRPPRLD